MAGDQVSTYADTPNTSAETLLERVKRCLKDAMEADADQRQREELALRFQVGSLQWDDASRNARAGGFEGGVAVPARPTLSISKLDQPIQIVLNQARNARLGVNIHPVSEDSDKEGAEVRQGLYRRIERDSNASQARLWALDRATKCGRGVYRVNKKWDEDADAETFDQEITIDCILDQSMVYFDPASQRPDKSDGEWAIVAAWVKADTFRRLYPLAELSQPDHGFGDLDTMEPDWIKGDGDGRAFLVAEYWYKVHTYETVEVDGYQGEKRVGKRKRERDIVSVKCVKLTGTEVLEEYDWEGKYIPLVPVPGRELQPINGQRRWTGMIEPSMDGQRLFNVAASTLVERMMLEPKTPWVMAEGQQEGHEAMWQQSNVRNFPYLLYKQVGLGEKQAPPPQRSQLDQTGMSLAMMAMQEADSWLQATTAVNAWSKGQADRNESGRKVLALQQQSDLMQ